MGLYITGWWFGLSKVEQLGGVVWKRIQPLGNRFIPVQTPWHAGLLGLLWGWLPCGLVYSVLVWSISTADPFYGAALLFCFGLGTLPNLLLMGVAATSLSARVRDPRTRRIAAALVVLFGLYSLFRLIR